MTRLLWTLVLLVAMPLAAFAQTVETAFDKPAFENTVERAEEVLEKATASDEALAQLRKQLVNFRSSATELKEQALTKTEPVQDRIDALGAPPAEGETEAEDVAALREQLNKELEKAKAPVKAAEDLYKQADGLISRIDDLMRHRSTARLVAQNDSPLDPRQISAAVTALITFNANLWAEVTNNLSNDNRASKRIGNLLMVAVLLAVALVLLVRSRVWSRRVQAFFSRNASSRTAALYGFIGSLSQLILPAIGLAVLVQALLLLDLFDLRGYFILRSLGVAGFSLYFASWLARSLFVATSNQGPLIEIDESLTGPMKRSFLALGLMFALRAMLDAAAVGSGQNPDLLAAIPTLTFPLIVVGGIALFRIGRVLANEAQVAGKQENGNPFLGRVATIMGNICVAAGVAGPVLAAFGFDSAGNRLVFSTAASLLLITGLYIFFRLIGSLTGYTGNTATSAGDEDETQRYGALFRVAVGFIMICIALPLLALIWGARLVDLQEVWLMARDGISFGDNRISLTDFLTFVLVFSIGYTITRILQSALRTTVLPNTRLDSGGQNAIVTGTGYVGIFFAALAAITATGLDLSNLAIVAGALSVGIGFGLQTIVSNFVSGIILLIERPIKAGDWIEVGTYSGYVRKISVRSTEVETFDRASVVIPNADLISGTVTNWTHSSMAGRVRVPVGVAYDSDPRHVEKILLDVAESHPMVLLDPGPAIMFMGFGADSLDFEIRAILRDVNWMLSAKSDMNFEIFKRFSEEGIEIPFAQRDVYIKNLDELAKVKNATDEDDKKKQPEESETPDETGDGDTTDQDQRQHSSAAKDTEDDSVSDDGGDAPGKV
ncbi:DUF3772 domain-containing protein [Neptunicoccus sediminis]|uniref:DUF3772 domain-containing protein n=1 Tax=Neptunicoccus sediminis TaxID=1892596 RepID=UPI000845EDC1|nr:DUF3772 domain-containing protein [Neptunicoccus sediminis]